LPGRNLAKKSLLGGKKVKAFNLSKFLTFGKAPLKRFLNLEARFEGKEVGEGIGPPFWALGFRIYGGNFPGFFH